MPGAGSFYRDLAQQVEGLGYDLLFHGDHLFMYGPNPDALVTLSHMAACTRNLLLGTGVLLPALREPAVMAKQIATLDYLCGGRFVLGIGVGGEIEQEWNAMQVPRETRYQGWFPYAMSPRRVREGVLALTKMTGALPAGYRIAYLLFAYVDADEARAKAMAGRVLGKRYAEDFDRLLGPRRSWKRWLARSTTWESGGWRGSISETFIASL